MNSSRPAPSEFAREAYFQIETEERDGTWYASEPGVSITGRSDDPFQAIINYFEFCQDSQLSPAGSRAGKGSDR